MKRLLVLGAGTAGTMIANKMRPRLAREQWEICVVDRDDCPSLPAGVAAATFGAYHPDPAGAKAHLLAGRGVEFVLAEVDRVDAGPARSALDHGRSLSYDYLVDRHRFVRPGPDHMPGTLGRPSGGAAFSTSTHSTAQPGATPLPWRFRLRPRRRPHHRHAHQMPGCAAGVHLPGGLHASVRHGIEQGRPGVRHSAVRRVHQADRRRHFGGMLEERSVSVEPDSLFQRIDPGAKKRSPITNGRSPSTCW